jgi:hypothetical protein
MSDTLRPPPPAAEAAAPVRSVAAWAALKNTPLVWARTACVARGWSNPRLDRVDEATYDAAVAAVQNLESR